MSLQAVVYSTLAFATLLLVGGVTAYINKGSVISLVAGGSFGIIIGVNGLFLSSKSFVQPVLFNLVLCALLAVGMGIRAVNSGKFMPAGLVTTLSLIMVAVYVKVLVSPPAKAKET